MDLPEAADGRSSRDVTIPLEALDALVAALEDVVDGDRDELLGAVDAAGSTAGRIIASRIPGAGEAGPGAREVDRFWSSLSELMARRGWGQVSHATPHPGVGVATLRPVRAGVPAPLGENGRAFAGGILSGLLSSVASAPVAVLALGGRASDTVELAFGSPATIRRLSTLLEEREVSLAEALSAL